MMMSYSWVCFLLGYAIYLLSPLLPTNDPKPRVASEITALGIGALAALNFQANSWLSRRAIRALKEDQERYVAKESKTRNEKFAPNVDDASKQPLDQTGSSDTSAS